jgi:integrase/recombinase XerC
VIYEGSGSLESRQASSCLTISQTLVRAGLGNERDVRPASVAAWVGARLLQAGAPIDEIARRLGKRSLDRTARFIGWDWRLVDG